jgi:hypothetical protein
MVKSAATIVLVHGAWADGKVSNFQEYLDTHAWAALYRSAQILCRLVKNR